MRHLSLQEVPSLHLTGEDFGELVDIMFSEPEEDPMPSLYDILDIEEDVQNAMAVDGLFPSSLLESAEQEVATQEVATQLLCEESLPSSPEGNIGSATGFQLQEVPEVLVGSDFVLDHPEVPGVNCKSCEYHKRRAEVEKVIRCSLCYMRMTAPFVYSKSSALFLIIDWVSVWEQITYNLFILR